MLFASGLHVHEVILVGSVWFWLVLVGLFVLVTVLSECQNSVGALFALLVGLAVLQAFGDADFLGYLWHHPFWILTYVALYFTGGVGNSLFKWRQYCRDQRSRYDDAKEWWLESKHIKDTTKIPTNLFHEWEKYLTTYKADIYPSRIGLDRWGIDMTIQEVKDNRGPRWKNHKARCLVWATYWPCSLVWTLLNDPIRKLFREAMQALRGVYEAIAATSWQGVSDDFQAENSASEGQQPLGADGRLLN